MHYLRYQSPIGGLILVADEQALKYVQWAEQAKDLIKGLSSPTPTPLLLKTSKQLNEYFEGIRTEFSLPLSLSGSSFQRSAWSALQTIPYGETISYTEQAQRINRMSSVRAIGLANSRNPLMIIIPCHRVIAKDGSLGGYAGGIERKQWLLNLEK